jgi:hypothetical protein
MTISLITNIVFASFILLVIPGMLARAIRTSRNESPPRGRVVGRPTPRPSYLSPRVSSGYGRLSAARAPARDAR